MLDVIATITSFVVSLALRFDAPSRLFDLYLGAYLWVLPILIVARIGAFLWLRLYQRVWRYASIAELRSIVLAIGASSVFSYAAVYAISAVFPQPEGFPRSVPVIETLVAAALTGGMRFSLLLVGLGRQGAGSATRDRALIVGAGSAGVNVARQLMADQSLGLVPIGFADDNERKGHQLLGLPILGSIDELRQLIGQHAVGTVLFALPQAEGSTLRRLVRVVAREGARSLTLPNMAEVLAGTSAAIRQIEMDDLLRRAPARTDLEAIRDSFHGRDILVSGAGGSIGTELCHQLLRYEPRRLVLLGRGENSIFDLLEPLSTAARESKSMTELVPVIMDIRDRAALASLIRRGAPDVVFHAAAHKHVAFMERYPQEAIANNVLGTRNVLEACQASGVGRFVFVSTDKAVRPTSVMGATKRIGEIIVRTTAERTGRPFVSVRFGNVLSSRGSVVPRFRRQLAQGGPLTVTHPHVRRYFMTVGEAVQLILQATVLAEPGETYVLDMGEPVRIDELARDLIELHGLVPGRDIQIVYTGLGAGEKLDEELFFAHERPRKTAHDSIWVAESGERERHIDLSPFERADPAASPPDLLALLQAALPEYQPSRPPDAAWDAASIERPEM